MWLFRFLFPTLGVQMPLLEQLACGLGLGMMAVAALTLGVKLCGFSGRGLILSVTVVGAIAEMWRNRKAYWTGMVAGYWKVVRSPIAIAILVTGSLVFLILFRLAGVQGLVDGDAMRWMLKAKIMHLYTGNELVQWFSNPRLAHAHLDYPTLVPSLHAATYDSLGHVDEFVTKFWPTWMLFFLIAALVSLNRAGNNWRHVASFALLGLLLLPVTQIYVQWEGSTLPMIFFTVMGFVRLGADIFIWRSHDTFRGVYFSGAGGKLDSAGAFGTAFLETDIVLLAGAGVLGSSGTTLRLLARPDTVIALSVRLGRLRPAQSRHHAFTLASHFYDSFCSIVCEPRPCKLEW
jgi:hypothetical protein